MGLAILPSRLKSELALLKEYILDGKDVASNEELNKHAEWVKGFMPGYDRIDASNIDEILRDETGKVFSRVLEDAGVFKQTEEGLSAFMRFADSL